MNFSSSRRARWSAAALILLNLRNALTSSRSTQKLPNAFPWLNQHTSLCISKSSWVGSSDSATSCQKRRCCALDVPLTKLMTRITLSITSFSSRLSLVQRPLWWMRQCIPSIWGAISFTPLTRPLWFPTIAGAPSVKIRLTLSNVNECSLNNSYTFINILSPVVCPSNGIRESSSFPSKYLT